MFLTFKILLQTFKIILQNNINTSSATIRDDFAKKTSSLADNCS